MGLGAFDGSIDEGHSSDLGGSRDAGFDKLDDSASAIAVEGAVAPSWRETIDDDAELIEWICRGNSQRDGLISLWAIGPYFDERVPGRS
jgi:hypothetical protein